MSDSSKSPRGHLLVAAGGHGRVVAEALPGPVVAYVDRHEAGWLDAERVASDDAALACGKLRGLALAPGLGGTRPEQLHARLEVLERYVAAGFAAPAVVHPAAWVSPSAELAPGVVVLAKAVVQATARLGRGVIVNSGAIVEHDCTLGAGCHVAPGATVLGDCELGEACMIGAGAVVLAGSRLPEAACRRVPWSRRRAAIPPEARPPPPQVQPLRCPLQR